jgi:5-aminopentanamidase
MLVAGWCEKSTGERPYNSAVVIDHGVVAGCYRKTHPLVCYDLEFPEVVRAAALGGAELIVARATGPEGWCPSVNDRSR